MNAMFRNKFEMFRNGKLQPYNTIQIMLDFQLILDTIFIYLYNEKTHWNSFYKQTEYMHYGAEKR